MKNIIHSFFAILMLAAVSFAQVNQQWVRSYNGPGNSNDAGYSIAVDASGNVYIAGSVYVTGQNNDYCVIKYSSGGVQQWVVTYNGPSSYDDAAISIGLDASSNIYVTGRSYSSASYDIYTMKISPAGGVFWGQTYNGPGNSEDMPVSMIVTPSGSVYIAGYSRGIGTLRDFTVIKYNTSGIIQWVQRYNGPANQEDVANALTLDPSGNLYAAGRSFVTGSYDDFCVVKYLPSGNVDWLQIYDSPYHSTDEAVGIVVDNGGNVYAGGKSIGTGTGYDYLLVKYNNSGNLQWAQRYNGTLSADDVLSGMVIDASNQIYLCGNGYGSGTGRDIVIVKYNPR